MQVVKWEAHIGHTLRERVKILRRTGYSDRQAANSIRLELREFCGIGKFDLDASAYRSAKRRNTRPYGRQGILFDIIEEFGGQPPSEVTLRRALEPVEQ